MSQDPRIADLERSAALWARRFGLTAADFRSKIRSTEIHAVHFTRLRVRGKSRHVTSRLASAEGRAAEGLGRVSPPVSADAFDPWAETNASLYAKTRQLIECPVCSGNKRIRCPGCNGSTRVACSSCLGTGLTFSFRSKKFINCKSCRGKGNRDCPACRTGTIACPQCEARGRVLRWLEIEEKPKEVIFSSAVNSLGDAIAEISFDRPLDLPVAPVNAWHGSPREAPAEIRNFLAETGLFAASFDRRHDRIDTFDYQRFVSEVAQVDYEMLGRSASVRVRVWDSQVVPEPENAGPLRRRLAYLGWSMLSVVLAGIFLAFWYGSRHRFFAASDHFGLLLVLALLQSPALIWPLSRIGVAELRSPRAIWGWLPVAALLIAQGATAATGYPSVLGARELERRGNLEAAAAEAEACVELAVDRTVCAEIHDRIRLARARAETRPEDAWKAVKGKFFLPDSQENAEQWALEITARQAAEMAAAGNLKDIGPLLALVDQKTRQSDPRFYPLLVQLHALRLESCVPSWDRGCLRKVLAAAESEGVRSSDLNSARDRARDATLEAVEIHYRAIRQGPRQRERSTACQEIQPALEFLVAVTTRPEADAKRKSDIQARCAAMAAAEQERQRQARATEVRKERQRQADRDSAPLRCRDGTLSPSCVCGQSSRRGCCSHHGGVAGCS